MLSFNGFMLYVVPLIVAVLVGYLTRDQANPTLCIGSQCAVAVGFGVWTWLMGEFPKAFFTWDTLWLLGMALIYVLVAMVTYAIASDPNERAYREEW